jgi:pyruvate dehydrogenase (quinone)
VPTLPPHITFDEARKFVSSMVEGDPGTPGMIRGAFKEAIQSFLPHSK